MSAEYAWYQGDNRRSVRPCSISYIQLSWCLLLWAATTFSKREQVNKKTLEWLRTTSRLHTTLKSWINVLRLKFNPTEFLWVYYVNSYVLFNLKYWLGLPGQNSASLKFCFAQQKVREQERTAVTLTGKRLCVWEPEPQTHSNAEILQCGEKRWENWWTGSDNQRILHLL